MVQIKLDEFLNARFYQVNPTCPYSGLLALLYRIPELNERQAQKERDSEQTDS